MNYEENFDDLLNTLEVDVPRTYVATGCGDCVPGVHPVATWPICSRRIILVRNGDDDWNAVHCTTVPGEPYVFGMDEPTCYTVLYEFMPDFIDYLKEAPFENELTMTKDVKTELNNSLDSMLGEQATFWEMWDTTEGTDDVVEIFGGLQNDDDMIVELYSPPRVVEAARARGLRASLSIDLVTGYDLRLAADKDRVREEIRKRKPRLLVTSPPCTKFSTMQHLRTNWDNWEEEIAEATDHVDFSMEMLGEQLDRGAHGLHEHPRTAKSWDLPSVRNYVNNDQVILVKGDQCRFGLKVGHDDKLNKKSTLFATTCDQIATNLQKLCQCVALNLMSIWWEVFL